MTTTRDLGNFLGRNLHTTFVKSCFVHKLISWIR